MKCLRAIPLVVAALIGGSVAVLEPAHATAADLITNGSFDDGLAGWTTYPTGSVVDGAGCIDVPAGSGAYSAGIAQHVPVAAGEQYTLTFDIKADPGSTTVRTVVQGGQDVGWTQFLPEQRVPLTPQWAHYSYTFTPTQDYASAEVTWQQYAANDAAYQLCVDNVSLVTANGPAGYQPDTGPRVRVNQVGYLAGGPKGATLVTDAVDPLPFDVIDAVGRTVLSGTTTPAGTDPTSGLNVQTLSFDSLPAGSGYRVVADGETSHPFDVTAAPYQPLVKDALSLFYTQRSGIAIDDKLAPGYGRAAGHLDVAPNTGDRNAVCLPLDDPAQQLYDQPWTCSGTHDVSGGWYDAGDQGKYVVNGAISVAQLMQEYERALRSKTAAGLLPDGSLAIPEAHNGVPDILDEARWELEWMLKMQVPAGEQYAGMAYHKVADADWTSLPTDPAADPQRRQIYRPSTAATLDLAAAAAQGARLFRRYDKGFADRLLAAAERAYAAAKANPVLLAPAPDPVKDPNPGSGDYSDPNVTDESYWAATELYLTTTRAAYQQDVLGSPAHTAPAFVDLGFEWKQVAAMARLDLATVANKLPDRSRVITDLRAAADRYVGNIRGNAFGLAYQPDDGNLAWGSNSSVLNILQVVGTAYDVTGVRAYRDAAVAGADYLFGRNALNISYVTGYGTVFSHNQHSRMYAHELDATLPEPPDGSLAGGPNSTATSTGDPVAADKLKDCVGQFCYIDDINSWSTNEIAINWNAPLAWYAAWATDVAGPQQSSPVAGASPATPVSGAAELVDTHIGTDGGGNTAPGATAPFGMTQPSPDGLSNSAGGGYSYQDTKIKGFSVNRVSGAGCGALGQVSLMPVTGTPESTDAADYASPFSHDSEQTDAGYYKVDLPRYGAKAELTATTRTAWERFTYSTGTPAVLVNVGAAQNSTLAANLTVVGRDTVEGTQTVEAFCGNSSPVTVHFVAKFSQPFAAIGTWSHSGIARGTRTASGTHAGAALRFGPGTTQVVARIGISYVDLAGAARNLAAETPATTAPNRALNLYDFNKVAAQNVANWNGWLNRAAVTGGTADQHVTYYTALYHALSTPNTFSDVDGRYEGMDGKVHVADGRVQYTNLSLWDTYRVQQQFLRVLARPVARDVVLSMIHDTEELGWVPRWVLANVETNVMSGDPSTPIFADALNTHLVSADELAPIYGLLYANATRPADNAGLSVGRVGIESYRANGWVAYDPSVYHQKSAASATLEWSLADAGMADIARALGHADHAADFAARALSYRNEFDATTGFFRPRKADGTWMAPFDPAHLSLPYLPDDGNGYGYDEGTAWQYLWLTPQNTPDLARLIGGTDAALQKLDQFFGGPWTGGDRFDPSNEIDLQAPYAYSALGSPAGTQKVVRAALTSAYDTTPSGISGNDDLGTMSAWYVMSAWGLYPYAAGQGDFVLTTPLFDRTVIHPVSGGDVQIDAPGTATRPYVGSLGVNGTSWNRSWISSAILSRGAQLTYGTSAAPTDWATGQAASLPVWATGS